MGCLDAELGITLTDDAQIADLAGRYGRPRAPTDVLAFALADGGYTGELLGDVVLSIERAEAQASERGVTLDRELRDLLIHGVLHLLGMDHDLRADARAMRELERHLGWELERP